MIVTLTALFAAQVASPATKVMPTPKPIVVAPLRPNAVTVAPQLRKDRLIADARALLIRAEQLNASYVPVAGQPTNAELDASIDQMQSDLDSLSEMGEMESLRLQMAMDRISKMMTTLSNIMKKASETQSSIIQNVK